MVLVKHITMSTALFSRMNPDFDKQIADNGEYELRLRGVTDSGSAEDVGFYYFNVKKR